MINKLPIDLKKIIKNYENKLYCKIKNEIIKWLRNRVLSEYRGKYKIIN